MIFVLIFICKVSMLISKALNIGSGSTWPGHIALNINANFIVNILNKNKNLKVILIAGTNGKTTTSKLIKTILEQNGKKVFHNEAGANLLNGIASSLIKNSDLIGEIKFDYAIFEVDENSLPLLLNSLKPKALVLLNLFRDQLDRYGEVNLVADKWRNSLGEIDAKTSLILNADDPKIAYFGQGIKNTVKYFGARGNKLQNHDHASDSTYCPKCGSKLKYESVTFSHLGDWSCDNCRLKRPKPDLESYASYPLPGLYNKYNVHAAVLAARSLGVLNEKINKAIKEFKPAFGRQEVVKFNNKNIQIFLSKNPASFNQSLETITELKARNVLLVLNDRIPDGRDVSWIWDVDFEDYLKGFKSVSISGDRAYDMALRIQYAIQNYNSKVKIYENLKTAVDKSAENLSNNETLHILPTYSAMLGLRKILTGKSIL